jgi:hypothetical protein
MKLTRGALLALVLACGSAVAGPYSDHVLIRATPSGAGERLAVASLGMTLMSESVRTDGVAEYLASPADLAVLDGAGVGYAVLRNDVQAAVDAERARLDARAVWGVDPQPRGTDPFFQEFRDLGEITTFLNDLVAAHPGLISRETIGQSIQGRAIEVFTIDGAGDADSKPSLVFNAGAHAREWIAPMTVLYQMRELLEGYGNDPAITELLDRVSFRVAPMMNPDGYLYTWSNERFWRKTRRNNGDGTFGVDWNRNFATGWGGPGADSSTDSDIYRGPAPFSEPETQALRDYSLSMPNGAFHIDFHAFSQLVLYPWGFTDSPIPEPDRSIQRTLAEAYAGTIASVTGFDYLPIPGHELYIASGIATDWHYDQAGMYSFTVELRPSSGGLGGFDPAPSEILPCAQENYAAVLQLAQTVADGVASSFPDGAPATVQPDQATPVSIEIIPVFSGPLDASTATLYTRIGSSGAFTPSSMSASGNTYTADLPAAPCGGTIEYYATIDAQGGASYAVPSGAPASVFSVEVVASTIAFEDTMESDLGWVAGVPGDDATTGQWERADPQGTAAQPENDHTPGGTLCWVTGPLAGSGLGSFDIDGGTTTLLSPVLDATGGDGDAFVSFWVWFSNDTGGNPNEDTMPIDISGDGGASWAPLDEIGASTAGWEERRYRLGDAVSATDAIRLRFRARDLGGGSLVEAAVDDLRIEFVGCPDEPGNPADLAPPFGVLDLADVTAFVQGFVAQDPIADLAEPFGVWDLADVSLFVAAFTGGMP